MLSDWLGNSALASYEGYLEPARIERQEHHIVSQHLFLGTSPGDFGSEERNIGWLRRVLFQCMAIRDESDSERDLGVPSLTRDGFSDEHLLGAHQFVLSTNKWRDWECEPKILRRGPPIIPASAFPSSRSNDFSGYIPRAEFDPLMKLLLVGQLYLSGRGLEGLGRGAGHTEAFSTTVLAAFPRASDVPCITWDLYDEILSAQLPNIYIGFAGLYTPLVSHDAARIEQISNLSKPETISVLRQTLSPPKDTPISISILDPYTFTQLSTFLPLELCFHGNSVTYAAHSVDFKLDALKNHLLGPKRQPLLIIVSGVALDVASPDERAQICVGTFLPESDADASLEEYLEQMPAIVFQLTPAYSAPYSPRTGPTLRSGGSLVEITFPKISRVDTQFILSEESQTASYYEVGEAGGEVSRPTHIKVEKMDLISLTFTSDISTY